MRLPTDKIVDSNTKFRAIHFLLIYNGCLYSLDWTILDWTIGMTSKLELCSFRESESKQNSILYAW